MVSKNDLPPDGRKDGLKLECFEGFLKYKFPDFSMQNCLKLEDPDVQRNPNLKR
jgi:hypothetical protein